MIETLLNNLIYQYTYTTLFLMSFGYFIFIYFVIAPSFNGMCKLLARKKLLHKITLKEVTKKQLLFEIKHSFSSIIIFGISIIPIVFLIRQGTIHLLPNTVFNFVLGLLILNLWNEVHFFIIHRILHMPFFMSKVHYIHHQSKVPTVYSIFSFHWFEAILLSTVPLTIALFIPFSFLSIAFYPITSALINYAGHCNYRFGNGSGKSWLLFGTNHNEHHYKNKNNYGFLLNVFDKLISQKNKNKL
ncbi:MAG: sterol desaturase family protein [Bacteroidota bacterium]|jgi:sterol desaturase/sphingolipid hydroxylase (fatty acid hydroxylase superfamily)